MFDRIDLTCDSPPSVNNAVLNSTKVFETYKSIIFYRCSTGFWFQKDVYYHKSICQRNATWQYVPPCVGKCIFILPLCFANKTLLSSKFI